MRRRKISRVIGKVRDVAEDVLAFLIDPLSSWKSPPKDPRNGL